jgi:hypothetical protein
MSKALPSLICCGGQPSKARQTTLLNRAEDDEARRVAHLVDMGRPVHSRAVFISAVAPEARFSRDCERQGSGSDAAINLGLAGKVIPGHPGHPGHPGLREERKVLLGRLALRRQSQVTAPSV